MKYELDELRNGVGYSSIKCDGKKLSFDDVVFLLNTYHMKMKEMCDDGGAYLEN